MFTGWGVRTLASDMGAYNPMSYHNGSVWPHDNALIAAGLMRYGFARRRSGSSYGLLDAAEVFGGRLPELFCGFDRAEFAWPVPYPTSCSPQAWAAASPIQLVRTLLRFEPCIPYGRVWLDPVELESLRITGLPLAGSRVTIDVGEEGVAVTGLPEGIALINEPAAPRHPLRRRSADQVRRTDPERIHRTDPLNGVQPCSPSVVPSEDVRGEVDMTSSDVRPWSEGMRIVMVAPPWYDVPPLGYGGIEAMMADLVAGLTGRGHDVTLIGAGSSGTSARFLSTYDQAPSERIGESMPEVLHAAKAYSMSPEARRRHRPRPFAGRAADRARADRADRGHLSRRGGR